ncbi:hypothetical protein [Salimicrobium halophilum]|uniref:Uncharacterized protein n=1 Tax=Salimicrobium halophilum TaxID=86666 RepID=A0A1G8R2X0_9BACI|nr:hypothetical protein [Salimicrobium halophilum]SDJ11298.1 hypothetical protein SAMN04490247_0787 [Salimicrobium halophilum]
MSRLKPYAGIVALFTIVSTILLAAGMLLLTEFGATDVEWVRTFGKVYLLIVLPYLMLAPLTGFVFSFFAEKRKPWLMLINGGLIIGVSFYAFIIFMFRYVVSFAP